MADSIAAALVKSDIGGAIFAIGEILSTFEEALIQDEPKSWRTTGTVTLTTPTKVEIQGDVSVVNGSTGFNLAGDVAVINGSEEFTTKVNGNVDVSGSSVSVTNTVDVSQSTVLSLEISGMALELSAMATTVAALAVALPEIVTAITAAAASLVTIVASTTATAASTASMALELPEILTAEGETKDAVVTVSDNFTDYVNYHKTDRVVGPGAYFATDGGIIRIYQAGGFANAPTEQVYGPILPFAGQNVRWTDSQFGSVSSLVMNASDPPELRTTGS